MSLLDAEEREQLEFIWNMIPEEDRQGMNEDDVLLVLDLLDDYLEEQGLLVADETNGEMEYLEGEVDETEQLNYVLEQVKAEGRHLTGVQVQLIMDGELQFGIEKGYYQEED